MTRRRKERAVSNSMSCPDAEWARIRAAAEAAGEAIGRHVVRRCLTDDPAPSARPRASQALSPEQQRHMYDAVIGMARTKPDPMLPEHPQLWILRLGILQVCVRRIEAMEREGRTEELHALLREAFGADDGADAAEAIRGGLRRALG